jgi:hypothetical protein
MIEKDSYGSKYIKVPHTILAAEGHLTEGQLLLDEQASDRESSLTYRAETPRLTVSKIGQNLKPR